MRRFGMVSAAWLFGLATTVSAQSVELILPPDTAEDLETAVRAASLTLTLEDTEDSVPQDYIAAARADYRRILTGLFGRGYYGPTISISVNGREASGIPPLDAPGAINSIVITVDPGQQFDFGRTEIAPQTPETTLPPEFASGEVAQADVIRVATQSAIGSWRDAGYALASVGDQQITANHSVGEIDVAVRIVPGAQLRFGNATISGNEAVRTERVAEIAGLPVGTIYSPDVIDRVQTRLRRTGTFRSVAVIEADTAGPNNTLPIEIQVIEDIPRRVGFGAEFSTLEGTTLSAFWLHRNLLGGAERLRFDAEASGIGGETGGIDYSLSASYSRPATFRPDIDLGISVGLQRLDEPLYFLDQFTVDVNLTQYESERVTYSAGIGLITAREETEIRTRDYTLITLPLSATYDRRNVILDPTEGYYLDVDVRPFVGVDGIGSGGRLFADGRYFYSPGESDRLTLAARLQVGSIIGASLNDAPSDFLFFSGGGGTVRGQSYQSLGINRIEDFGDGPQEVSTGGASFVGAQLEARFDVTDTIGVVGFYDIGMVGEDAFPTSNDEYHAGAGLGIRYDTGIGPIRLDIATPASGDNIGGRVEVYIGIGQSF